MPTRLQPPCTGSAGGAPGPGPRPPLLPKGSGGAILIQLQPSLTHWPGTPPALPDTGFPLGPLGMGALPEALALPGGPGPEELPPLAENTQAAHTHQAPPREGRGPSPMALELHGLTPV